MDEAGHISAENLSSLSFRFSKQLSWSNRSVELLYGILPDGELKSEIAVDPLLEFSTEEARRICSHFLSAETVFKISIERKDFYRGIDVDAILDNEKISDADQRTMLKSLSRCIHIEITQIVEDGQQPLRFGSEAYEKPIAEILRERNNDNRDDNGYVFITCNDRIISADLYRFKRVGWSAACFVTVLILSGAIVYGFVTGHTSPTEDFVPY